MVAAKLSFILFASFAVLIPGLQDNIAEYDEFWLQRAEEARKDALEAYHPNPEEITEQFNTHVNE